MVLGNQILATLSQDVAVGVSGLGFAASTSVLEPDVNLPWLDSQFSSQICFLVTIGPLKCLESVFEQPYLRFCEPQLLAWPCNNVSLMKQNYKLSTVLEIITMIIYIPPTNMMAGTQSLQWLSLQVMKGRWFWFRRWIIKIIYLLPHHSCHAGSFRQNHHDAHDHGNGVLFRIRLRVESRTTQQLNTEILCRRRDTLLLRLFVERLGPCEGENNHVQRRSKPITRVAMQIIPLHDWHPVKDASSCMQN
jgi:hypothetical protein